MRYFTLLIGLCSLLGCSRRVDDRIFEQSFNQRLASTIAGHKTRLTQKEHGWKAQYTLPPKNKKRFIGDIRLLLNFKGDSVKISSDYRAGKFDDTIGYRITQGWKFELVFESYSPIHALYELQGFLSGGGFIFNFNSSSTPDSIILDRRLNRREPELTPEARQKLTPNRLILTPANPVDWTKMEAQKAVAQEMEKITAIRLSGSDLLVSYSSVYKLITITLVPKKIIPSQPPQTRTDTEIPAIEKKAFVKIHATGFTLSKPVTLFSTQMVGFTYDKNRKAFICNEDKTISMQ